MADAAVAERITNGTLASAEAASSVASALAPEARASVDRDPALFGRALAKAAAGAALNPMVVVAAGVDRDHATVAAELVALVRDEIGTVAFFKDARIVSALPKTRSGKILRRTISNVGDGEP